MIRCTNPVFCSCNLAGVLLISSLLAGCAGNIGAAVPFGAALASCSSSADADRMVPGIKELPSPDWMYSFTEVRVEGPEKSTIPPPILAATFKDALERSLGKSGVTGDKATSREKQYVLVATIVSQARQGTFKTTTLEVTIRYRVISRDNPGGILWEKLVTTTGEIKDWKIDACKRLRNLQERLSKENILILFNSLPARR